jgi:hypothetical protein
MAHTQRAQYQEAGVDLNLQIPNLLVGPEAVTMVTHVSEEHTYSIFSAEYKKHKQQAQSPKWEVVRSSESW